MKTDLISLYSLDVVGTLTSWRIPRKDLLQSLYHIIGCDFVEAVRTTLPGILMIVDDCGAINGSPINEKAAVFYRGWSHGIPICGTVVFVAEELTDDGLEWSPLNACQTVMLLKGLDPNVSSELYED